MCAQLYAVQATRVKVVKYDSRQPRCDLGYSITPRLSLEGKEKKEKAVNLPIGLDGNRGKRLCGERAAG